jgi:CBS domain-containing protein
MGIEYPVTTATSDSRPIHRPASPPMARIAGCDYFGAMKVHEIMTPHARCVAPENTLVEAAGLMRQLDVGALPVCENDRLAGMVTDRDIVLRGVADGRPSESATVSEVMSQGIIYVFGDQEIEEAARLMEEKQIRRLPVLSREKRMIGILSIGDMAVTANPAFSGMALKEVSQTPEGRMKGGKTSGAIHRAEKEADERSEKRKARRGARGAAKSTKRRTRAATATRTRKQATRRPRATSRTKKRMVSRAR